MGFVLGALTGLSIASNFSFAFANVSLLVTFLFFSSREAGEQRLQITLGAVGSFCVILILFCGSAVFGMPKNQLFWGTQSWLDSLREIQGSSLVELNRNLVNPLLQTVLITLKPFLFTGTIGIILFYALLRLWRSGWQLLQVPAFLAAVLGSTMLSHWLQFMLLGIPLPLERTSLFMVPLVTLLVGSVVAAPAVSAPLRWTRAAGIVCLSICALFFAGELRDTYFNEWRNCADIKAAFPVVVQQCRRLNVKDVAADPNLSRSFNFYRMLDSETHVNEFANLDTMPSDRSVYALLESGAAEFIQKEQLRIVWRGTTSDLVIAVRE
jgi:membrane protein CcdC involved in cytochrome C biogenesis